MIYLDNCLFKKVGYLTEINRLYLHPLGLNMILDEDEELKIIDNRDKKEGIIFQNLDEQTKSRSKLLEEEYNNRRLYRMQRFGWTVQPLDEE